MLAESNTQQVIEAVKLYGNKESRDVLIIIRIIRIIIMMTSQRNNLS